MSTHKIQYAYLASKRRPIRELHNFINKIVSKYGQKVEWHKRGYNTITLEPKGRIYFRMRGANKFVKWLELMSHNIEILKEIRGSFPSLFKAKVELKSGLL